MQEEEQEYWGKLDKKVVAFASYVLTSLQEIKGYFVMSNERNGKWRKLQKIKWIYECILKNNLFEKFDKKENENYMGMH